MNISPVSFGRTIRVNAPLNVAQRMADLVNQTRDVEDRDERSSQQKLKTIFYDSNVGRAQTVSIDNKSYIVTGEESIRVSDARLDMTIHVFDAKGTYGEGDMLELVKDEETKRCNEFLDVIVKHSAEPVSILPKYNNVPKSKEVDSDQTRVKIKSINVIL